MIRGRPVTAVIPVRGGSRGIPGKNLRELGGMTLLERAIRYAQAAPCVDRVLVTTDDPEMHEIAVRLRAAAPGLRPPELASDTATTVDAVRHLMDSAGVEEGYILLLQVTTPLRTQADLSGLVAFFEAHGDASAAASVAPHAGAHPEKLQKVEDDRLVSYLGREAGRARQLMPEVWELNGAFYLIDTRTLLAEGTFLPSGTLAYRMPVERSSNLDTMHDWNVLTSMLACGHWALEE